MYIYSLGINIYIHTLTRSEGQGDALVEGLVEHIHIYWVPERRYYVPQIRHIHIVLRTTVVSLYSKPTCVCTCIYIKYNNPLCSVFLLKVYILYIVLRAAPELQLLLLFFPSPRTYNIHAHTIHTHTHIRMHSNIYNIWPIHCYFLLFSRASNVTMLTQRIANT